MKPRVSFIVPVRNDAARLETCLRSIAANSQRPDQIEIIVVDNGSTDDSPAVASKFGIRGVPTVLVFKGGSEVHRMLGVRPKAEIARVLERLL